MDGRAPRRTIVAVWIRSAVGVLAGMSLLAACNAGSGNPLTDPPSQVVDDSKARSFLATSADGIELSPGDVITIKLYDGTISAYISCNEIGGDYSIVDGQLTVGTMSTTDVACQPPNDAQDGWVWSLLESSPRFELNGSVLTIGGTQFLESSASNPDDLTLIGTKWAVGLVVSMPPDGGEWSTEGGTVDFSADAIDVWVSCHHTRIPATIDQQGRRITVTHPVAGWRAPAPTTTTTTSAPVTTFVPPTTSPPPCDENMHTEWEAKVLAALASDMTYEIDINRAMLRHEDGTGIDLIGPAVPDPEIPTAPEPVSTGDRGAFGADVVRTVERALVGTQASDAVARLRAAGWTVTVGEQTASPTTVTPDLRWDRLVVWTRDGVVVEISFD